MPNSIYFCMKIHVICKGGKPMDEGNGTLSDSKKRYFRFTTKDSKDSRTGGCKLPSKLKLPERTKAKIIE